jgi:transposase InsO family protein
MGWQTRSAMEEKMKFLRIYESGEYTFSELCRIFEISRTTGYKLLARYEKEGLKCCIERPRRPLNVPHRTPEKIERAIIALRKQHPRWGARKLMVLLGRKVPKDQVPSETTVNAILKRNGLVKSRKRRGHRVGKEYPEFRPTNCNEIWSADYKGKFRLGNYRYCHPLTICDSYSRYLFTSKGHYYPTYKAVKEEFKRVFKAYGMPVYMHTDNGVPFGSMQSIQRYSQLSYWLIDLGIYPLFSDPGCPQQNGRHERMHRDLKAYCTQPVSSTLTKQQAVMDRFVGEYNEVRPHEALKMETPGSIHERSSRSYPEKIVAYDYPWSFRKLKVTKNGAIRWGAYNWVYISRGAIKKYVGLEELENGIWKVYYRDVVLGYFDESKIESKEQHLKLSKTIV